MSKPTVRGLSPKIAPVTATALMELPLHADGAASHSADSQQPTVRKRRSLPAPLAAKRFAPVGHDEHGTNHQAELFYLQKQIQLQTQMIFVLEDGQRVQGVVEWYDRNSIKVRGKSRVLIYKSAIKYLYKMGEIGLPPEK